MAYRGIKDQNTCPEVGRAICVSCSPECKTTYKKFSQCYYWIEMMKLEWDHIELMVHRIHLDMMAEWSYWIPEETNDGFIAIDDSIYQLKRLRNKYPSMSKSDMIYTIEMVRDNLDTIANLIYKLQETENVKTKEE